MAAEAGPGRRGRRRHLTSVERSQLAEKLGEDAPAHLLSETEWVERSAKLFEAGNYPDKGVKVESRDLDVICECFDIPVPVLIEHSESPLHLGYLTEVERTGRELFGTIALTQEANALVEQSGAKSLSLGLTSDLRQIREVSLVRNPRVADAKLFSGSLYERETPDPQVAFEAEKQVDTWMRQGRLTPAQAPFVKALLSAGDAIEFEGSRKPLRQLVIAMVDRQPPYSLFTELVPASNVEAAENLMLPEEAEFYRRHFPDVTLGEIASRRNRP